MRGVLVVRKEGRKRNSSPVLPTINLNLVWDTLNQEKKSQPKIRLAKMRLSGPPCLEAKKELLSVALHCIRQPLNLTLL